MRDAPPLPLLAPDPELTVGLSVAGFAQRGQILHRVVATQAVAMVDVERAVELHLVGVAELAAEARAPQHRTT